MEKRVLIAAALSISLLLLWQWIFPTPPPVPRAPEPTAQAAAELPAAKPEAERSAEPARPTPVERVASAAVEVVEVETDLLQVTLTNKGARVSFWGLRAYPTDGGKAVDLIPELAAARDQLPLAIDLDDAEMARRANEALYRVEREDVAAAEGRAAGRRVRFTWADDSGVRVEKSLVFRDGDYMVDVQLSVTDRGRALPARLTWGPGFAARDAVTGGSFHYVGQALLHDGLQVTRLARDSAKADLRQAAGSLLWAGLEEQYFTALIIPAVPRGELVVRSVVPAGPPGANGTKKPEADLVVAVPVPAEGAQLYVGPKKFTLLRSYGRRLEEVVWFSNYALVSWLGRHLFLALVWLHDRLVPNWGLALILLTVALRIVLFPLNQYSMVNMRKMQTQMQRIQPKINAVKAKFKKKDAETRALMNKELMALYQKEGVNPMGGVSGCLPMLAQFPILIAFYDVLIAAVELRGAPFFGWIHDLTQKDPYYVTPILMGATMFLQQMMSTTKAADPQQAQQQKIMLMMPVVFTVMFINLPSGLVLYWFVNNLLGIGQQWLVNRHIGRLEAAPQKA